MTRSADKGTASAVGLVVTVRAAAQGELNAAGECVRAAYEADGLGDLAYLASIADANARAETSDVLVATDAAGKVLGSVTFILPGSPWAELAKSGETELRMLGISPQARGRGVAQALVAACLSRSTKSGARRVVLCSQAAMAAAHRLYARFGFVRAPELDWEPEPGMKLVGFALDMH